MKPLLFLLALGSITLALAPRTPARPSGSPACAASLRDGHWQSAGGNDWWVVCRGDEVFWLGMNKPAGDTLAGRAWAHVAYGHLRGTTLSLRWADIPLGTADTDGAIEVAVLSDTTMAVSRDDGVFGKPQWHWVGAH